MQTYNTYILISDSEMPKALSDVILVDAIVCWTRVNLLAHEEVEENVTFQGKELISSYEDGSISIAEFLIRLATYYANVK